MQRWGVKSSPGHVMGRLGAVTISDRWTAAPHDLVQTEPPLKLHTSAKISAHYPSLIIRVESLPLIDLPTNVFLESRVCNFNGSSGEYYDSYRNNSLGSWSGLRFRLMHTWLR